METGSNQLGRRSRQGRRGADEEATSRDGSRRGGHGGRARFLGVPAFAASGYGAVNVTKDDQAQTVTIGNDAITRTFSFKGKKLKPGKIENKLDKNGGGGSLLPMALRSL